MQRTTPPAADAYELITTPAGLAELCRRLADEPIVSFDTEFVSEDTHRPQLCLIQVAAGDNLAVIDPLAVRDVLPFWQALTAGGPERRTVVHAGREELLFCLHDVGAPPVALFDLQIGAALVGYDYPAGYASLMQKLLGRRPHKGETRTDWRRRPLTPQQLDYALDDVRYLAPMYRLLSTRLTELDRWSWMDAEMATWQDEVTATRSRERWWKVSGISGLSNRSLAIVRELWRWRDAEAQRRDCPARRVLRDDLIIELAKRKSADPKQIRAIRGLERGDLQRLMPQISAAIERALALPDAECPQTTHREMPPQVMMLGQFLSSALASICHAAALAPSIVGTPSDVRDLVAFRLGLEGAATDEPPLLGRGWRAEVVGQVIDDLLAGRTAIRIRDPMSDEPLSFEC